MATTPVSLAQFGQNIKAKHPEYGDMADEDVASRVLKKYPQYQDMVLPAGATGPLPGVPQPPNPMQPPTMLDRAATGLTNAGDALVGAGKGALHTISSTDQFARDHLPAVLTNSNLGFGKPADLQNVQRMATPNNTAQKVGYGAEQVGEFLAPGDAEAVGAGKLAALAPKLGRYAAPAAKVATGALASGLVNKAQGGTFTGGAAIGAAGGVAAQSMKAVAPLIAESALGVRATDRAFKSRNAVGNAILSETKGVNPANITAQASQKVTDYGNQLGALDNASPQMVDLAQAQANAAGDVGQAYSRNNKDTIRRTQELLDQLSTDKLSNSPMPSLVAPARARALKQGLGDLKGSWNPATPNTFADGAVGRAYGTVEKNLDTAVPGSAQLDDKLSALRPVVTRAAATDLNAGVAQRIMGRLTRPTGALFSSGAGSLYGYQHGGVEGALLGGAAGLLGPELIGAPETQMLAARAMSHAAMPPTVRVLSGVGLQATRKPSLYGPQQK